MKKIAILACLKVGMSCTGSGCLKAFNARTRFFEPYRNEDAELVGFFRCNGCGNPPEQDEKMIKKLDKLKSNGVDVLHLGGCTHKKGIECPTVTKIAEMAEERGIAVVRGTHH